jgi:hypothetical protein
VLRWYAARCNWRADRVTDLPGCCWVPDGLDGAGSAPVFECFLFFLCDKAE